MEQLMLRGDTDQILKAGEIKDIGLQVMPGFGL